MSAPFRHHEVMTSLREVSRERDTSSPHPFTFVGAESFCGSAASMAATTNSFSRPNHPPSNAGRQMAWRLRGLDDSELSELGCAFLCVSQSRGVGVAAAQTLQGSHPYLGPGRVETGTR